MISHSFQSLKVVISTNDRGKKVKGLAWLICRIKICIMTAKPNPPEQKPFNFSPPYNTTSSMDLIFDFKHVAIS